jgi:hypothetical protein
MSGSTRTSSVKRGRHRAKAPLGPRLRRAAVVLIASMGAVLGVSAAGVAEPPAAAVDQRFLVDVRGRGHEVAAGTDEALLVSAARKLCVRRESQTSLQRRTGTLNSEELGAVERSFGGDSQAFIKLATRTYC